MKMVKKVSIMIISLSVLQIANVFSAAGDWQKSFDQFDDFQQKLDQKKVFMDNYWRLRDQGIKFESDHVGNLYSLIEYKARRLGLDLGKALKRYIWIKENNLAQGGNALDILWIDLIEKILDPIEQQRALDLYRQERLQAELLWASLVE